ncbi:MAG: hypothetical protein M1379_10870 [Firmicutes bacterium]|nr:hypothetical protein [Bacillota bacterium]
MLIVFLTLGLLAVWGTGARAALQVGGYFETTGQGMFGGGSPSGDDTPSYLLANHLKLRLDLPDYKDFGAHAEFNAVHLSGAEQPGISDLQPISIDRLYVTYNNPAFDLTVGKQRFSWGMGTAFRPVDRFNPPNPVDPSSTRAGKNGVELTVPLGQLSSISAIAVHDGGGASGAGVANPWTTGLRARTNVGQTDLAVSVADDRVRDARTLGLEAKGDLLVGYHAEAVYEYPGRAFDQGKWTYAVGVDNSWGENLFALVEYLHDQSGGDSPEKYRWDLLGTSRQWLGTDYLFGALTYKTDDYSSLSLSVLRNLKDEGTIITPGFTTEVADGVTLSLKGILVRAPEGSEYRPAGPLPGMREATVEARLKLAF